MVLASVTAAAFILMFLPVFAFDFLEKRQRTAALRLLAADRLRAGAVLRRGGHRHARGMGGMPWPPPTRPKSPRARSATGPTA